VRNGSTLNGINLDGLSDEQVARLRALYATPAGEPVTTRYAFCDSAMSGPADETAAAFREHQCERRRASSDARGRAAL